MLKRSLMGLVLLFLFAGNVQAMDKEQTKTSVFGSFFALIFGSQAKESQAKISPDAPAQEKMMYMSKANEYNHTVPERVAPIELFYKYPGGPLVYEEEPQSQRCYLRLSCNSGGCCPGHN